MSAPAPEEIVRLMFEARAAGDVRQMLALMDPDVRAAMGPDEDHLSHGVAAVKRYLVREAASGPKIEVDAHRLEPDGADGVRVYGRIRIIDRGALSDSPAAWHFTVRGGRVVAIAPLSADHSPLGRVA